MVIVDTGASAIRNAIASILDEGQYGDGTTTAINADTTLESAITSSNKTLDVSQSGKSIQAVHELLSTDSNGESLSEFATFTSDNTMITRNTTTAVSKDNTKEIITTTTFFIGIN